MTPAQSRRPSDRAGLRERLEEVWLESARSGAPMPGEPALAERLASSRPAIREALVRLEERGYIHRRQGADTVVNRRMLDVSARIDEQIDRSELITSTGRRASMVVVENSIDTVTADEVNKYGSAVDARVLRTTKVWFADGVPVICADDSIALPDPASPQIDATEPVFEIAARFGLGATEWEIVYPSATAVTARVAALLDITEGQPALSMDVVGVNRAGLTAYWSTELHATNAFQHTMIRLVRK